MARTSRARDSTGCEVASESSSAEVLHSLHDLLARIHDEGAVARDRLVQRPSRHEDETCGRFTGRGKRTLARSEHREIAAHELAQIRAHVRDALIRISECVV